MEMGDQEQQQVLVPELAEQSGAIIRIELIAISPYERQSLSCDNDPRVAAKMRAVALPEPILAIALLEISQRVFGVGQAVRLSRPCNKRESHEIPACELGGIIHRLISHKRP